MSTLFNRSSLTYANAQLEVARAAGINDPNDPLIARAGDSLDAVAQKWNRMRWIFLQTEQIIGLIAPFTVTGCSTTAGSTTVTTTDVFTSVLVDDVANGAGLRPDTLVLATGATALVMAAAASANATANITFKRAFYPLNSDFKKLFDARLMGSPKPIYYQPRRLYDREVIDQNSPSEPYGYDLYPIAEKGKLRILPPPGGVETLWIKYYRRMTMPSALATSIGLDIPEDFEDVFIAGAKAHFLADKGQPHREQWLFWKAYYEDGIKEMRRDERLVPDEDLALQPPLPQRIYGPNSPFYRPDWGF